MGGHHEEYSFCWHGGPYGNHKSVYVPDVPDEQIRDYIRMRNDHKDALKRLKQQINAFCIRVDAIYTDGRQKWTQAHVVWLRKLELAPLHHEILDEYLISFDSMNNRLALFDRRIEEMAAEARYREQAIKLVFPSQHYAFTYKDALMITGNS